MTAYNVSNSNLFAYCGNNPVMRGDADGEFWNIVIGAVVGGLCGVISSYLSGEEVSIGTFVSGAMMGALGAVTSFKYVAAAVNCVVTVGTCVSAGIDPLTSLALGATTAATSLVGFGKLFKGDSVAKLAETVLTSQINTVSAITVGGITGVIRKDKPKTSHTSSNSHRTKRSTWDTCDRAGAPNAFYEVDAKK